MFCLFIFILQEVATEEMLGGLDINEESGDKPQKLSKAQKRRVSSSL